MNAREELAQLRLREQELLRLTCVSCGHTLPSHGRTVCRGSFGAHNACDCRGWQDPERQMELVS